MKIGVLCLQGAFIEHINILNSLGVETFEIRQEKDIMTDFDGLVLPGGESTTMGKLLIELNIFTHIQNAIKKGTPVFGTCAGLILLAKKIDNDDKVHLGTLDIVVKRNAYGRQLGSFIDNKKFNDVNIPMTFIRAPYVSSKGDNVEVLSIVNDKIVAVREGNQLATAFHPELTECTEVHNYFISIISERLGKSS